MPEKIRYFFSVVEHMIEIIPKWKEIGGQNELI